MGSDPNTSPRYYYVYNGHGDVVALVDANGNVVAHYHYDAFGNLTDNTEQIPNANGWVNPYRYDGRDGVRYDSETGLYWMSVRAYDPTLGRFLSRDLLGRVPLFFADQPYVYAGNNPLTNVDPSGQRVAMAVGAGRSNTPTSTKGTLMQPTRGGKCTSKKACDQERIKAYNTRITAWATEIGTLSAARPRLITSGKPVTPGTSGAITPIGTLAACAGATLVSIVAAAARREPQRKTGETGATLEWDIVTVATGACSGLAGSLVDSILGATVQRINWRPHCDSETEQTVHHCGTETKPVRGLKWMDNDMVNVLSTAAGARVAAGLRSIGGKARMYSKTTRETSGQRPCHVRSPASQSLRWKT